jgi:hypothetical protein
MTDLIDGILTNGLLTDEDLEDYLDNIEDPCNKADNLVALIDRCKLLAAKYESMAAEHRQSAKLWEYRLQKLQGIGVRLLKDSPMHSVEASNHILGLDRTMPEVKAAACRRYTTDWMIPDDFKFSIPESYREPKIIWELKVDDVKNALLSGKKLNFARLVDKQRLRILNKTEEQYVTNE